MQFVLTLNAGSSTLMRLHTCIANSLRTSHTHRPLPPIHTHTISLYFSLYSLQSTYASHTHRRSLSLSHSLFSLICNASIQHTCVVFPLPVSPTSTIIWFSCKRPRNRSFCSHTGNFFLFSSMSKYRCENGCPLRGLMLYRWRGEKWECVWVSE